MAGVQASQWTWLTPNEGWDVGALLNHIVTGNLCRLELIKFQALRSRPEGIIVALAEQLSSQFGHCITLSSQGWREVRRAPDLGPDPQRPRKAHAAPGSTHGPRAVCNDAL